MKYEYDEAEEVRQDSPAEADERESTAPLSEKLGFGMGTFLVAGGVDLVAHFGLTGLVVGGIAAYAASRHGPQLLEQVRGAMPEHFALARTPARTPRCLAVDGQSARRRRSVLDRALGRFPDEDDDPQQDELDMVLVADPTLGAEEEDALFASVPRREVPGVSRLTVEQIVAHIVPNSYSLYIGRSLTRVSERYPAVRISFFKRHLKLIGASQKGKSSMAAALLDIITRTHDPAHVLLALLDLEDQTSQLFAHLPHVAEVLLGEERIRLHARSREQVLEHLEYVLAIMEQRYRLSKLELAEQPILLVFIEEFLALKDYFKRRIDAVRAGERDQARADYARLIFAISELARRGLKVRVQLLLCAQVDYRDEDLQEALINITAGLSFAVRVSAAQAAGFYDVDLLKRNALDNTIGQAVVETPDCHDLILTPDYDLEARLLAYEQAQMERERRQQRYALAQAAQAAVPSADWSMRRVNVPPPPPLMPPLEPARSEPVRPPMPPRQPAPTLLERGVAAYLDGATSQPKLAAALDISPWDARKLMPQVEAEVKRQHEQEQA